MRERPKLLYTVPTFQNPTGRTLPAARRAAVAAGGRAAGAVDRRGRPLRRAALRGRAGAVDRPYEGAADRTVLLGSFSKVMAPGLRLGWLRAPEVLRRACAVAKQAADLHTPTVNQLAAARYLTDRDLDAHVARVAGVYRERRDAMLAGLPDALPEGSAWNRPEGGMFLWARLPTSYDTTACSPGWCGTTWPTCPVRPSTPARPTARPCGCAS